MPEDEARTNLRKLVEIGIALTRIHDLGTLLEMIVQRAREFTHCDAGSLYIKEGDHLIFSVSQNATLIRRLGKERAEAMFKSFTIPLSKKSIAGYVAVTGETLNIEDVYKIPSGQEYQFNREFDERNNYRTKSMIVAPMRNAEGEMVGVLQLINAMGPGGEVRSFPVETEELVNSLASMAAVGITNARHAQELREANYDTIFRLALAAELNEPDTAAHLHRMRRYSGILARQLGFSREEQEIIFHAAAAHDVGKVAIPHDILCKPGPLTEEEWAIMRSHPVLGAKVFANSRWRIGKICEAIALTHHEKWDGTGYPNGLKGEAIPMHGRIVALADVFDALMSPRCYKAPFPTEKTLNIIREGRGVHFCPAVTDAFFTRLDEIMSIFEECKEESSFAAELKKS